MCCALASTSVNDDSSSRMCHTGFQYTPVASIATCVQPASVSQAASSSRPAVVVATVHEAEVGLPEGKALFSRSPEPGHGAPA